MMSLYSQYMQEREGKLVLEEDHGFAVYSFLTDTKGDKAVYLQDIFVTKAFRQSGLATQMADKVAVLAKEAGCIKMYGTVSPNAKGCTDSLKVLLAYGFQLSNTTNELIAMVKDI